MIERGPFQCSLLLGAPVVSRTAYLEDDTHVDEREKVVCIEPRQVRCAAFSSLNAIVSAAARAPVPLATRVWRFTVAKVASIWSEILPVRGRDLEVSQKLGDIGDQELHG